MEFCRDPCSDGRGFHLATCIPCGSARIHIQTSLVEKTELHSVHLGVGNTHYGAEKGLAWSWAALTTAWLFPALLDFKV